MTLNKGIEPIQISLEKKLNGGEPKQLTEHTKNDSDDKHLDITCTTILYIYVYIDVCVCMYVCLCMYLCMCVYMISAL